MATLKNDIKKVWRELPSSARLGITLIGGFIVFKKVRGFWDKIKTTPESAKSDEKKFIEQGQVATYPDASYTGWADIIYNEYFNSVWSSFSDVKYIFEKMQNDLDVSKLIQAFGKRRILFSTGTGDLQTIIIKIDDDAPQQVNQIFETKGIKYRF